jgi:ElaB/YqjD/DUF883 family membrane-anchored ribosome-binding protein
MAVEDQNPNQSPMMENPGKPRQRNRQAKRSSGNGRRGSTRSQSSSQDRSMARATESGTEALSRRGKRLVEDARSWADEARSSVPRFARNMHLPSPPSLETFTEANPVILGAVGLGIGVLIGALLPRDVFHSSMQGLTGAMTSPRPTRSSGRSSRSSK